MKKNKKKILFSIIIMILLFIFYTLLVKYYDVKSIGPENTKVGFAAINNLFYTHFGYNELLYKITKYLGFIPFLLVAFYAFVGLKQLLKEKSLAKVDKKLIILGCFYILVGFVYLLFELFVVNYRPIILEEGLEASYPSSHTILAICICVSSLMISKYYIKNKNILKIFNIFTIILMSIIVLGRLFSGVHWFTDIIGGVIVSIVLLNMFYYGIYWFLKKK